MERVISLEKELEIYKKALWDYVLCFLRIKNKKATWVEAGFCFYFGRKLSSIRSLPYLSMLEPNKKVVVDSMKYWFPMGACLPRIRLLRKAIKLTKKAIAHQKIIDDTKL